ncbi:MAG TPA: FAD-dependent oxidoreductase [Ilumatobacteraceae bacterium]|nr:FAD-dependent oxidoreductase [Ilumatobacteraceae bacterium]
MRIVVVGAGLTGLTAARSLDAGGHEVLVLDKGRSPGGRMATRRIGDATFDHGAQFFTVRGDALAAQVAAWEVDGVVRVWCHGFTADGDGYPRYVGTRGMTAIAKHMAGGLDVRCGAMVFAIRRPIGSGNGWEVVVDDGTVHRADAVISTCPLPQTFSLLFEAGVDLPRELVADDYDRTIALLAVLDGPSAVPPPGGAQQPDGIFSFVADNSVKGISAVPAVTLHAGPAWSLEHWDAPRPAVHDALIAAAAPWFGTARLVDSQVKRWRFATPRSPWPEPCWVAPDGSLVVAGDAFAGPKVEGAYNSGLAAAAALTHS